MATKVSSLTMFRGQVRPNNRVGADETMALVVLSGSEESVVISPDLPVRRSLDELLPPAAAAMMFVGGLLVVAASNG